MKRTDVMVFQIRFQNIFVNMNVFPTLEAGWSTGGCLAPKMMYEQDDLHSDRQKELMPGEESE